MTGKKDKKKSGTWVGGSLACSVDAGDVAVFCAMAVHVIVCPYTKVEESFNMQAMYDLAHHGANISAYDHMEFPGVVPRSFLGPLGLQLFLAPVTQLQSLVAKEESKFHGQIRGRLALGIVVLLALQRYRKAVRGVFGPAVATGMMLLTASQFHFVFYMSRPLPNVFALVLVLLATQAWMEKKHAPFVCLSALVILVFRTELALFLGSMLLIELYSKRLSVARAAAYSIPAGISCLGLTVLVDSYLWQRWLWPEGEVFYFNAILNKSGQYGTSPYLWYIYSVIPRCLLASVLFIPESLRVEPRTRVLLFPVAAFVLLFSVLPHKELRFIIYVVPVLNTLAAATCVRLWQNRSKSRLRAALALLGIGHVAVNAAVSAGLLYVSHHNYPGGLAMRLLHEAEPKGADVNVHLDVYSCQTGITRFTQLHDNWRYNKTEDLPPGGVDLMAFTHLLIGVTSPEMPEVAAYKRTHKVLATAQGFSRVQFNGLEGLRRWRPFDIIIEPKAVVLKRL